MLQHMYLHIIQIYQHLLSTGSWSDLGMILSSRIGSAYSAIDSNIFIDPVTGRWTLTFGSFNPGISQLELNPQTGKVN
jgi:hypothetical protein